MNTKGICRACLHAAHCEHSCVDEDCDYCSECYCEKCNPTKEDDGDGVAETKLDDDSGYKIVTPRASKRTLAGLT